MRNIFLIFGILLHFASLPRAAAQIAEEYQSAINIGIGCESSTQLLEGAHGGEDGYYAKYINKYYGTWSVTYSYRPGNKLFPAMAVIYENEAGRLQEFVSRAPLGVNTKRLGTFRRNVWTVAPELRFTYSRQNANNYRAWNKSGVRTYGYIGVAITFVNEIDNYYHEYYFGTFYNGKSPLGTSPVVLNNRHYFNCQLCPVGIAFGNKSGGFIEFGFGYKGVFNTGYFLKF